MKEQLSIIEALQELKELNESPLFTSHNPVDDFINFKVNWSSDIRMYAGHIEISFNDINNNTFYCAFKGPSGYDLSKGNGGEVWVDVSEDEIDAEVRLDKDALTFNINHGFFALIKDYNMHNVIELHGENEVCKALNISLDTLNLLIEKLKKFAYEAYEEDLENVVINNWERFV